jgi:hypothetical protein
VLQGEPAPGHPDPYEVKTDQMRRLPLALALLACLTAAIFYVAPSGSDATTTPRGPKGFFGIVPQTELTDREVEYMKAGGIETIRWPLVWGAIQPTRKGGYDWGSFDPIVSIAARHGMKVLPFVYSTPRWLAGKPTTEPINNALQRREWQKFLEAAVKRYGPGGEFWAAHAPGVVQYEPAIATPLPIRTWQVWNEANFFYFAYPASPQNYARLLKQSTPVIKRVDPKAQVILSGLFGEPTAHGPKGMPAREFLEYVYSVPGIKSYFDGVALHPYAVDDETLEELVEGFHEVMLENHDRVPLYITEMGWGSQNDFKTDAFEQGPRGQVEQMQGAYSFLLQNRTRLDLKQVYWFSWKDLAESCSFCDSVGFFHAGRNFRPKPSWRAFVAITRGKVRP